MNYIKSVRNRRRYIGKHDNGRVVFLGGIISHFLVCDCVMK